MIVEFIDDNRDEFGVEPICRSLPVAPSTYYWRFGFHGEVGVMVASRFQLGLPA